MKTNSILKTCSLVVITWLSLLADGTAQESRVWKNKFGQTLAGALDKIDGDKVTFIGTEESQKMSAMAKPRVGKTVTSPISMLSQADLSYIKQQKLGPDGRPIVPAKAEMAPKATAAVSNCPPFKAIFNLPIESADEQGGEPMVFDSVEQKVSVLLDINPGKNPSKPRAGTVAGGKIYFWADDRDNGTRIWCISDHAKSIKPVDADYKAIGVGFGGSERLSATGDAVFFAGRNQNWQLSSADNSVKPVGPPGGALFVTPKAFLMTELSGSRGQLGKIFEIDPNTGRLTQAIPSFKNDRYALVWVKKVNGRWLGVKATTHELLLGDQIGRDGDFNKAPPIAKSICVNSLPNPAVNCVVLGDRMVFSGYEEVVTADNRKFKKLGVELYVTDGTSGGTTLVKDILNVAGDDKGSAPSRFVIWGRKAFFQAKGETWVTDGTEAGTVSLPALPRITASLPLENGLAFTDSSELWWSDGTQEGSRLITRMEKLEGKPQKLGKGLIFWGESDKKRGFWWWDGNPDSKPSFVGACAKRPYSMVGLPGSTEVISSQADNYFTVVPMTN